jgi:hypothetical protein
MQVFYIYPREVGLLISDGTRTNILAVEDRDALITLKKRIDGYLANGSDDGTMFLPAQSVGSSLGASQPITALDIVTTQQALQMAEEAGFHLITQTINSACMRGQIAGAHKPKGRWRMPRQEFLIWFEDWKLKQGRQGVGSRE